MNKKRDLVKGETYGEWTVLGDYKATPRSSYLCKCSCGKIKRVQKSHLVSGQSTKCGSCSVRISSTKHGFTSHKGCDRFYRIYFDIKDRCYNKKTPRYYRYGGRGIKCSRKTFKEFRDDMYESYLEHVKIYGEKETTIDRIDIDDDYYKGNCKRSTYKEQANNTSRTRYFDYEGEKLTARQIADKLGTTYYKVYYRLGRHKGTIEQLIKDINK